MHWDDEGVILSVRPHGETAAVVDVLTREHGRHLGLVHGGQSRKQRPVLQQGNHVAVSWRGRLQEHLGTFTIEPRRSYATEVLDSPPALAALMSLCALTRTLPERDPHPNLYEITLFVLGFLEDESVWPALLVRWELALLDELGFGIDLSRCAATGVETGLVYVSPKSGRAVSADAGEPFKDRLLALPPFLAGSTAGDVTSKDIVSGLALTAYFLETRVYAPLGQTLPDPRQRLASLMAAA